MLDQETPSGQGQSERVKAKSLAERSGAEIMKTCMDTLGADIESLIKDKEAVSDLAKLAERVKPIASQIANDLAHARGSGALVNETIVDNVTEKIIVGVMSNDAQGAVKKIHRYLKEAYFDAIRSAQ